MSICNRATSELHLKETKKSSVILVKYEEINSYHCLSGLEEGGLLCLNKNMIYFYIIFVFDLFTAAVHHFLMCLLFACFVRSSNRHYRNSQVELRRKQKRDDVYTALKCTRLPLQ